MIRFTIVLVAMGCICFRSQACAREPLLVRGPSSPVMVGHGSGRILLSNINRLFAAGAGACNVAAGDVNEDGTLDVAASSFEGDGLTILLGR
jgi:hypothetical protein